MISHFVHAVPANPRPISFSQPNGKTVTVKIKGDEKVNWYESMDGYTLLFNKEKYLSYAYLDNDQNLQPSSFIATDINERDITVNSFLNSIEKNLFYSKTQIQFMLQIKAIEDKTTHVSRNGRSLEGQFKTICALVQFPDKSMTKSLNDFEGLFNQLGYTGNGDFGSVRDFFKESSYNKFDLTIKLCGIYTAPQNESYYSANDDDNCFILGAWLAEKVAAEPGIDFRDFDSDNDGWVDGFHFVFAGMGREAGGDANCIWSHQYGWTPPISQNGVKIDTYSCTPELIGTRITTIGVICHEMTHAFGELDFYDTDYEVGGQFEGTGKWDLMAAGSWNGNQGNCPAHHNIYTKIKFGWVTPTVLNSPTSVKNMSNAAENPVAYRINTATNNEYFLLENRQQVKFDKEIPGNGLIIYRVAADIGSCGNKINATHPQRMYPVCASATVAIPNSSPSSYGNINSSGCPFPGSSNKTSFTDATTPSMKSWANTNTNKPITNITNVNKLISFDFGGEDQSDCDPASNLNVSYNSSCEAKLTWSDPPSKESAGEQIIKNTNRPDKANFNRAEFLKARMASLELSKPASSPLLMNRGTILKENFESVEWPDFPTDWTINTDPYDFDLSWIVDDVESWELCDDLKAQDGKNAAIKLWSLGDPAPHNAWMFSCGVSLTAGTTYNISFWLTGKGSDPAKEKLEVKIGTSASASGMTTQLYDNPDVNMDWTKISKTFTPTTSGTYYLGFHAYSDYDGFYILVDNVEITDGGGDPPGGDFTYNIYRDGTKISTVTTNSYTDKGFNTGVGHTWMVKVACSGGGESNPISKTLAGCEVGVETNTNDGFRIYPNPTTGELRIENGEWRMEKVEIFDVMGKSIVIPNGAQRNEESNTINISFLANGVYFLKIQTEQGTIVKKVIKN
jgi:M6 family metalloprotease-like protein